MSDRFNESMFGQLADDEDDSMGDFMSVLLSSPSPEKRRRQAFENFPAQFTYEGQKYCYFGLRTGTDGYTEITLP